MELTATLTTTHVLLSNGLVYLPSTRRTYKPSNEILGTVCSNLAYYGYTLSKEAFDTLSRMSDTAIGKWWGEFEAEAQSITGDDKNMADFVVYKNFPREVLEKSEAEYWLAQIFMYWGVPNEFFTETVEDREPLDELQTLKVLHLANDSSLTNILNDLLALPTRWIYTQEAVVDYLIFTAGIDVEVSTIKFKENLVAVAAKMIERDILVKINSATDVIRLAIGLSDGDISMRTNTNFRNFKRRERRYLLTLLNSATNLIEDMGRYKGKWKKLMGKLHPNDYTVFTNVSEAYDALYNDNITTFEGELEVYLSTGNPKALDLISTRPGVFARKLFKMVGVYGADAVTSFLKIADQLTTTQLLKLEGFLNTVNYKSFRTIAPKGNWGRLQILDQTKRMDNNCRLLLLGGITTLVGSRVTNLVGTVNLDERTKNIKLQDNDSELTNYGVGTSFDIPENMTFIRTASYWQHPSGGYNTWYDNGWNFFDENWGSKGTVCWDSNVIGETAVFSGDPTNSKDMKGRACQMIDLYIDKLVASGVRYAVWNILCFSHRSFNDADEVFATLQWGENAQTGKLYEPSRAQLAFPVVGDNLTKYIAYIDLVERKVVYMDANFNGNVSSARNNAAKLSSTMPAYLEYLDAKPSVYDVFKGVPTNKKKGLPVMYSDAKVKITEGDAYVFRTENEENKFNSLPITKFI